MACILLLDDSDMAARALQGILARGNHTCVVATTTEDAWRLLREGVVVDLVIAEMKLAKQDCGAFLQRVRDDWFWKNLPIVVYTYETDQKQVRRALGLKVQNYLVKPYNEQLVHAEVAKAKAAAWRDLHFEEPRSFCAQLGLTPDALAKMRRQIIADYEEAAKVFPLWAGERDNAEVFARLGALANDAETAGVWAGVDYIAELRSQAEQDNWAAFQSCGEPFVFAARLVHCQLNPTHVPECLRSESQREELREAGEKARWHVVIDETGPLVSGPELEKQILGLAGCPVTDTVVANFRMAADGRAASMIHVLELVARDPGLCAQVLAAANKGNVDDMVEDPKAAATLLGEIKLNTLAKALPVVPERHLEVAPFGWTSYWTFLIGVSKLSQFICQYLDLAYLSGSASTAGLLHDLGKMVLAKLHPFGFQAIVRYAQDKKVPLAEAEKKHVTWTSRDIGVRFAEHFRLPPAFVDVIRSVERPDLAGANTDLVAIVSLARHICLSSHVGCGDLPGAATEPIAKTAAWVVLEPRLFPSFEMKKFEAQAHAFCLDLRKELAGGESKGRAAVDRAVALVR